MKIFKITEKFSSPFLHIPVRFFSILYIRQASNIGRVKFRTELNLNNFTDIRTRVRQLALITKQSGFKNFPLAYEYLQLAILLIGPGLKTGLIYEYILIGITG